MKRGFTLIEMLVVLAILSILLTMAVPAYGRYVVRAKRTEGQVALIEAMQQQERYRMQHNRYAGFAAGGNDMPPGFRWWSGASAAASRYELEARACPGGDLSDCVEMRATPGTARVDRRFRDEECGALSLDSQGRQGAEKAGRCWP